MGGQHVYNALATRWLCVGNTLATSTTWSNVAQRCQLEETVAQIRRVHLTIYVSDSPFIYGYSGPIAEFTSNEKVGRMVASISTSNLKPNDDVYKNSNSRTRTNLINSVLFKKCFRHIFECEQLGLQDGY